MPPDDPRERQRCPGPPGSSRPCKNWPWSHQTRYCRNHDPALAEQRRFNGRVRTKPPPALPALPVLAVLQGGAQQRRPEWGPTKRELEHQESADRIARQQELLEAELPSDAELRQEALRALRSMILDPGAAEGPRVQAIGKMLDATRPKSDAIDGMPESPMSLEEALRQ